MLKIVKNCLYLMVLFGITSLNAQGNAKPELMDLWEGRAHFIDEGVWIEWPNGKNIPIGKINFTLANGKIYGYSYVCSEKHKDIDPDCKWAGAVGLITSPINDGLVWEWYNPNTPIVMDAGNLGNATVVGDLDGRYALWADVLRNSHSDWEMVYEMAPFGWTSWHLWGSWKGEQSIGYATSADGEQWTKHSQQQAIIPFDDKLPHENKGIGTPNVILKDGEYHVFYHSWGTNGNVNKPPDIQICVASGPSLQDLSKNSKNPIIKTVNNTWESGSVADRTIIKEGDFYFMVYDGSKDATFKDYEWNFGSSSTSSGLARTHENDFPLRWEKYAENPILPISKDEFGYMNPQLIKINGWYYLYYNLWHSGLKTMAYRRAKLQWKEDQMAAIKALLLEQE